ncbi:MAG: hypothetical protein ACP5OP_03315, partial [Leptospirillia bacterium]
LERTPTLETFEVVLETSQGKPRGKRRPKVVRERWAFRFLEAVPLRAGPLGEGTKSRIAARGCPSILTDI